MITEMPPPMPEEIESSKWVYIVPALETSLNEEAVKATTLADSEGDVAAHVRQHVARVREDLSQVHSHDYRFSSKYRPAGGKVILKNLAGALNSALVREGKPYRYPGAGSRISLADGTVVRVVAIEPTMEAAREDYPEPEKVLVAGADEHKHSLREDVEFLPAVYVCEKEAPSFVGELERALANKKERAESPGYEAHKRENVLGHVERVSRDLEWLPEDIRNTATGDSESVPRLIKVLNQSLDMRKEPYQYVKVGDVVEMDVSGHRELCRVMQISTSFVPASSGSEESYIYSSGTALFDRHLSRQEFLPLYYLFEKA